MDTKQIKSEPVKTVLVITVGMLVLYLITKWKWSLSVSLIVGVAGLLSSYIAKMIDFFWMKLTWVLSLIIPNIILTVIFFLFLTPVALLSRLFGEKDKLSLKNTPQSLFKACNKQIDRITFEKPW